ncbi:MAG: thermonuclease family protein [Rhizobiales bacterium]|nr:thermonuclease family protein [Hyphomicrobiales bacterium]
MVLSIRSFSGRNGLQLLLTAAAFAIGLAMGATFGPNIADRSAASATLRLQAPDNMAAMLQPIGGHPAEVLKILDGDTFEARVRIWPGIDVTTKVRLRGIDTPELKARCAEEYAKAIESRETLKAILGEGGVTISNVTFDKYGGRVVADAATRATPNIADVMLKSEMARRYSGGRRRSWCP